MSKKKAPKKKKSYKASKVPPVVVEHLEAIYALAAALEAGSIRSKSNLVSTTCPKCNLRLSIPEVESTRCILCGCKELVKQPYV